MILLAARIVNGKPVYTNGPFQSFEEIGRWSEAPWVSVDSPR